MLNPSRSIYFACALLLTLSAGVSAAQGPQSGIAGVVVSKQSGGPVSDAVVAVDGGSQTATTASDTGPPDCFETTTPAIPL